RRRLRRLAAPSPGRLCDYPTRIRRSRPVIDRPLKVSLIMPTYHRQHCIGQAVNSVLAQTYPHWQLIVSDNGGDGYRFDDPRIVVLDSRGAASAAYARNQAIPHASGDLVGFLDDD